jgi:hypothetical protein
MDVKGRQKIRTVSGGKNLGKRQLEVMKGHAKITLRKRGTGSEYGR